MKSFFLIFLLFVAEILTAQKTSFMFEESEAPSDWQVQNGALSITGNHYKEGKQSLCWITNSNQSTLTVSIRAFNTGGRGFVMFIRSPRITDDHLRIEFIDNNNNVQRVANVRVNFKGWRELIRLYSDFSTNTAFTLSKVRFTLLCADATSRKLFLDNVNFNSDPVNKNFGYHWILDKTVFTKENRTLNEYSNPVDIGISTPTQRELNDLATLRERLPRVSNSTMNLLAARNLIRSYNIARNDDGSVKGNIIDCSLNTFTVSFATNILDAVQVLGSRKSASLSDSILFVNMVDHMLDQGFAEGISLRINPNAYDDARAIPAGILNIVSLLPDDERKLEMLKLARWLSGYGTIYYPEGEYLNKFDSDVIYNYLPHFYGYALLQPDDKVAIRELKALKRYLERHTEVVPGTSDMIKVDGTSFHHWTHYNNYMYSFKTWGEFIYHLRGTFFNMNELSYTRFRDAVLAMYKMANKHKGGGNHFTANSLAGRNPYTRGGIGIHVGGKNVLNGMIEASKTIFSSGFDKKLAAAYNFFYDTNEFDVPAENYDGYYQFNYSPIGVARKKDWVVVMRAPTSNFWGAEIYSNQNRFGRYQSHGSMEVVYSGVYERSGIPITSGSGGWDWNVVPGTTTVHYTSWREMMPNKNTTDRFDQRALNTNFSGALADGNNGVFATDFVQGDEWGSRRFVPTNLKFKKSIFTFDSLFVCLGSDIASVGDYSNSMLTGTNLFQEIKSSYFSDFIVNDVAYSEGSTINLSNTRNNWLLTPLGTGYFVPPGNDNLVVKYGPQTTPVETGADVDVPTTTTTAVKAYINHGVKPNGKSYHFAMIPNTNVNAMRALSTQIGTDGGTVYKIESQTSKLHAVTHLQSETTGYSFFTEVADIPFGIVKSTTSEHLLMMQKDRNFNRLHFTACNPDLRPQSNADFGFLSSPTTTTITIRGTWKILQATEGVGNVVWVGEDTKITLTMREGMPEKFTLGSLEDTKIENPVEKDKWVKLSCDNDNYVLSFLESGLQHKIEIYSLCGQKILSVMTTDEVYKINQEMNGGICLLKVSSGDKLLFFKILR